MGGCMSTEGRAAEQHQERSAKYKEATLELNRAAAEEEINKGLIESFKYGWLKEPEAEETFQKAVKHFIKATELDPTYDRGFAQLGRLLEMDRKIDDAEKVTNKALALNPNNLIAIMVREWIREDKKEIESGKHIFPYIIDFKATTADDWMIKAGTLKKFLDRPKEAEECYKEAFKLDQKNPHILWGIVQLSPVTEEEIPTTLEYSDFLANLVPEAPFDILYTKSNILANAYYLTHEKTYLNQSIDLISYILQHKPDWIVEYCFRGKLYMERNQPGDAKLATADFRKALELFQDPANLENLSEGNISWIKSVLLYHFSIIESFEEIATTQLETLDVKSAPSNQKEELEKFNEEVTAVNGIKQKIIADAGESFNSKTSEKGIYMSAQELKMEMFADMLKTLEAQNRKLQEEIYGVRKQLSSKADLTQVSRVVKLNAEMEYSDAKFCKVLSDPQLLEYHNAFTKTLYTAHHVAMGIAGGGAMDSSNFISTASNLISMLPFPGSSAVGGIISKSAEMWTAKEMRTKAAKLTKVNSPSEVEKLIYDVSIKMTLSPSTQDAIHHPQVKVKSWTSNISDFCSKLQTKVSDTIYGGNEYKSDAGKLGDMHARKVLKIIYDDDVEIFSPVTDALEAQIVKLALMGE